MWENILMYINPELFILIIFVYCLGLFLKLYKGFKKEWAIPWILLGISIIFTILYSCIVVNNEFNASIILSAVIQGTIISAIPVFGNELIKQGLVKRKIDAGE